VAVAIEGGSATSEKLAVNAWRDVAQAFTRRLRDRPDVKELPTDAWEPNVT